MLYSIYIYLYISWTYSARGMSIYIVDDKYLRGFDRKQFIWATYAGCYGVYILYCTVTRDEVNYYLIVIKYI